MLATRLNLGDISPQIIHMCESNPNPCHIRDSECCYVYVNPSMRDLLDLADSFNILGKRLSETFHWLYVFADEFCRYDEMVMLQKSTISLLVTSTFGRENTIQPFIFDVRPFFDNVGNVVGTITESRLCKFFSPLQYIDNESPIALTSHAPDTNFTESELKVIFFTYHGLSSKETARRLGISHRTVENKLQYIYQKSGEHNINQFREFCRDIDLDSHIPSDFMQCNIRVIN